jgi:hypothetical protein
MAILLDYPNKVSVHDWYTSSDNLDAWMYAKGMRKPNYPVPAILYEVEIKSDRVILWNFSSVWCFDYLTK